MVVRVTEESGHSGRLTGRRLYNLVVLTCDTGTSTGAQTQTLPDGTDTQTLSTKVGRVETCRRPWYSPTSEVDDSNRNVSFYSRGFTGDRTSFRKRNRQDLHDGKCREYLHRNNVITVPKILREVPLNVRDSCEVISLR